MSRGWRGFEDTGEIWGHDAENIPPVGREYVRNANARSIEFTDGSSRITVVAVSACPEHALQRE